VKGAFSGARERSRPRLTPTCRYSRKSASPDRRARR
jgi:hypothetical protein